MNWITIIGVITGSGLTTLLVTTLTLKAQYKKENALANQEEAKVKQEEINAINGIDEIYTKMVSQVNKRIDDNDVISQCINAADLREDFEKKLRFDKRTIIQLGVYFK